MVKLDSIAISPYNSNHILMMSKKFLGSAQSKNVEVSDSQYKVYTYVQKKSSCPCHTIFFSLFSSTSKAGIQEGIVRCGGQTCVPAD